MGPSPAFQLPSDGNAPQRFSRAREAPRRDARHGGDRGRTNDFPQSVRPVAWTGDIGVGVKRAIPDGSIWDERAVRMRHIHQPV